MVDKINTPERLSLESLSEAFRTVSIPKNASFFRKLLAFSGPGYLVAVGYMDPGNWATDLSGGAKFGYALLFVILLSNLMAVLLQYLSAKLGIATGRDLAQMSKEAYSKPVGIFMWLISEIMIIACDLAEVIGSAIALNLLFHIPLVIGIIITAADVFLLLMLQKKGFRYLEALVISLIAIIAGSFLLEIILSSPQFGPLINGFIPTASLVTNKEMLYIAIGIIGATVMPHNLFLHSSVVQTRSFNLDYEGKKEAIKFSAIDSTLALTVAFFVNAAILVVAAAAFHGSGNQDVTDIGVAYNLLTPLLGTSLASIVFGVSLLASGQNSTLTGTLTGQIIMEGFLNLRIKPWIRRLITRLIAIVPALIIIIYFQNYGLGALLVFSQVVLGIALPFAVVPLVMFTSDKKKMGPFANNLLVKITAYAVAALLITLNVWLIYGLFIG